MKFRFENVSRPASRVFSWPVGFLLTKIISKSALESKLKRRYRLSTIKALFPSKEALFPSKEKKFFLLVGLDGCHAFVTDVTLSRVIHINPIPLRIAFNRNLLCTRDKRDIPILTLFPEIDFCHLTHFKGSFPVTKTKKSFFLAVKTLSFYKAIFSFPCHDNDCKCHGKHFYLKIAKTIKNAKELTKTTTSDMQCLQRLMEICIDLGTEFYITGYSEWHTDTLKLVIKNPNRKEG